MKPENYYKSDKQHRARLNRAVCALEGLAVGDAFGETFFHGTIHRRGVQNSGRNPLGVPWKTATNWLFEGQGSWGNGAAMRVAPLGAFFADDFDALIENAVRSALVTHHHTEGIAGAVAVAVAAAVAWNRRGLSPLTRPELIEAVLPHVPDSLVRAKLRHARDLAVDCSVRLAVAALGNGTGVSAQDTVPFALWCAGERFGNYEEALWLTVEGLGDRDTTCAIVGGIVACYTGTDTIPVPWRSAREAYPDWF